MAWLEVQVDLSRIAKALERIADAIERLSPPPRLPGEAKPAVFIDVNPSTIAEAEEEAHRKREAGTEGA